MSTRIDTWETMNKCIKFYTEPQEPLQVGIMVRDIGHIVKPHYHNDTQEVLFVITGRVEVNFDGKTEIATQGDVIILNKGVHSLKFLQPSRVLEVKQGPFKDDKVYV